MKVARTSLETSNIDDGLKKVHVPIYTSANNSQYIVILQTKHVLRYLLHSVIDVNSCIKNNKRDTVLKQNKVELLCTRRLVFHNPKESLKYHVNTTKA